MIGDKPVLERKVTFIHSERSNTLSSIDAKETLNEESTTKSQKSRGDTSHKSIGSKGEISHKSQTSRGEMSPGTKRRELVK